jgi:hypothetical protein
VTTADESRSAAARNPIAQRGARRFRARPAPRPQPSRGRGASLSHCAHSREAERRPPAHAGPGAPFGFELALQGVGARRSHRREAPRGFSRTISFVPQAFSHSIAVDRRQARFRGGTDIAFPSARAAATSTATRSRPPEFGLRGRTEVRNRPRGRTPRKPSRLAEKPKRYPDDGAFTRSERSTRDRPIRRTDRIAERAAESLQEHRLHESPRPPSRPPKTSRIDPRPSQHSRRAGGSRWTSAADDRVRSERRSLRRALRRCRPPADTGARRATTLSVHGGRPRCSRRALSGPVVRSGLPFVFRSGVEPLTLAHVDRRERATDDEPAEDPRR